MLVFVLMIWLMILGIKLGFRVLSFAGRIILGMLGVFVMLSLAGVAGAVVLLFAVPALLLALVF